MQLQCAVLETHVLQVTTFRQNGHEKEEWRKRGAISQTPVLREKVLLICGKVLRCQEGCFSNVVSTGIRLLSHEDLDERGAMTTFAK